MLSFSIIIPTYNRPAKLAVCLESLTRLDYPKSALEVIVVDDGSRQPYDAVIAPFRNRLNIQLHCKENGGPASARNFAAHYATGDFFAFTDDDCQPDTYWLWRLADQLEAVPDALVGGHTINALTNNVFSSASQLIADVVYSHYNADPQHASFFASNNMALSADRFREIGGFNSVFYKAASEDRELCDRWKFNGCRMIYVRTAIIHHAHDLTLGSFIRQHLNYGRGAYHFHRVRSARQSGSLVRETEFHLNMSNWLLDPIRRAPGLRRKIQTFFVLLLWQVTNAIGYFVEFARMRGQRRAEAAAIKGDLSA